MSVDSLALPRLDLMKIDVEGMEMEVINGAWQSISRHKPILQIEVLKSNPQQITDTLTKLGYKLFQYDIDLLAIHETDPCLNHINTN